MRFESESYDRLAKNNLMESRLGRRAELKDFGEGQRFRREACHATWCKPGEIVRYDFGGWYQIYPEFKSYYDGLSPAEKEYIRTRMDGNLCLVPEWIVWMVKGKKHVVRLIA